ncbi:MAG TPA: ABC transporter permease [Gammaproteobacteria bacterium]|nr:ABC transporter permease [Gammaproteobacteria bacterium]
MPSSALGTTAQALRSFWRGGKPWFWGCVLVAIVALCYLGPLVIPLPAPNSTDFLHTLTPPLSPGHILGTDSLGRDLLSRCLYGGRISLEVGFGAVALGLVIGSTLGILAGYKGRLVDATIMRALDILLAFPALILALVVATYLGPNERNIILAIAFFTIPAYARLARATTLRIREMDYVRAARMWGASDWYVGFWHVFPNVILPVTTYAFILVGVAMIIQAALSFLGLGVPPPQASWGSIIASGQGDLSVAPYISLIPGAFLFLSVVALNRLGDNLQRRIASG